MCNLDDYYFGMEEVYILFLPGIPPPKIVAILGYFTHSKKKKRIIILKN